MMLSRASPPCLSSAEDPALAGKKEEPPLWRLLSGDLACVKARDPAARHPLETLLTYPGVHAVMLHRVANRFWRRGWKFAARFLAWFARLVTNVDIHPGATIGERLFIDHGAGVVIGETAVVGDGVTLYHGVTLGGTSWAPGRRHPTLEAGVLVGAGAKILGAITVGAGARVGANSVVIKDVPPGVTVVGIPGKIVREARERRPLANGRIDLEHHQMPDPVGEAIRELLDRISFLEAQQQHLKAELKAARARSAASAAPLDPSYLSNRTLAEERTVDDSGESSACSAAPIIPLAKETDVLAKLKKLSAAEDFFTALGVPFEPQVLAVARLHILKRMGEYLGGDDLEGLPDSIVVARCRSYLERAYADFLASSPLKERVFKVLKEAVEPKAPARAFVPLDDLPG